MGTIKKTLTAADLQVVTLIGFDEETKQILRDLTQAIVSQKAPVINLKSVDSTVLEALVKGLANAPVGNSAPAQTAMTPAAKPAPKLNIQEKEYDVTPSTTLTQIRELINAKVNEGKKPAIIALLGEHGATTASNLEEDQFDAFYVNLAKL